MTLWQQLRAIFAEMREGLRPVTKEEIRKVIESSPYREWTPLAYIRGSFGNRWFATLIHATLAEMQADGEVACRSYRCGAGDHKLHFSYRLRVPS